MPPIIRISLLILILLIPFVNAESFIFEEYQRTTIKTEDEWEINTYQNILIQTNATQIIFQIRNPQGDYWFNEIYDIEDDIFIKRIKVMNNIKTGEYFIVVITPEEEIVENVFIVEEKWWKKLWRKFKQIIY